MIESTEHKIAIERMQRLFELASQRTLMGGDSLKLAKKYTFIAKGISKHYRISMPKEIQRNICKKCDAILIPGINCNVRVSRGWIIKKCNICSTQKRIFI